MKQTKKVMLAVLSTTIAFSTLLTASITFAWLLHEYNLGENINTPGELAGLITTKYWDKDSVAENKWTAINVENPVPLYLGEMTRIDELPNESNTYFVFNFSETSDATTQYQLIIESINISIYSHYLEDEVAVAEVSYYDSDPGQEVFSAFIVIDDDAALNPLTLFADTSLMDEHHIDTEDFALTPLFLEPTDFIYVNFTLRLTELQNVIDNIPLDISPYTINFDFNFALEKRTIDEE